MVLTLPRAEPVSDESSRQTYRLVIAVPFYRNERLVASFMAGLRRCVDEINALGACVVFYNDSPDYCALAAALEEAAHARPSGLPISVRTNLTNLGWVKTASLAMQHAVDLDADLILFNSDTIVAPGALTEMVRVSKVDPMIGFVNPRSNNATLASFPIGERFRAAPFEQALAAHEALAPMLPELSYVPTAVGFAMLIRKNILQEFGYFDEAYGAGYCEENDLVMRASRCGYRAVLANHAFVWHQGEQSFEGDARKDIAEKANHALLVQRYPEYDGLIQHWFGGAEHRAELLISQLAPQPNGKLRIAFDFSSFGPYHSGTQKAGVQLLQAAAEQWSDRFEISVLCHRDNFEFHKLDTLDVTQCDPHGADLFAAVFRVGQPFEWDAIRRLALKGAVVGMFMLDTISIDCSHLHDPQVANIWHYALRNCDFVVYNSEFTHQQFVRRFAASLPELQSASLHSLDYDDYRPDQVESGALSEDIASLPNDYVLVFGNQYPHKAVGHVANRLAEELPEMNFVALGVTSLGTAIAGSPSGLRHSAGQRDDKLDARGNLQGFRVGRLRDADIEALQSKAKFMVMPSHYEGFGFPVVHALAIGKPIFARRLPPLVEIWEGLGKPANLHFFDTTDELISRLRQAPAWVGPVRANPRAGDAKRAADDVLDILERAIRRASYERMQARFRGVQAIYGAARSLPASRPEFAAQRIGQISEHIFNALFKLPGVFTVTRWTYRAYDTIRRR